MKNNIDQFEKEGFLKLGKLAIHEHLQEVESQVLSQPRFHTLFMSEEAFSEKPEFKGVNPKNGRNLAQSIFPATHDIWMELFAHPFFTDLLTPKFSVVDAKFVCGIPSTMLPTWVKKELDLKAIKNLGPYINSPYRDITYFSGIDLHQDIIDWSNMEPNLLTVYIYLNQVTVDDAPLYLLPRSHLLGCSEFPHNLTIQSDSVIYKNAGANITEKPSVLTGEAGDIYCWHPFTLHGTKPVRNKKPRLSLRLLLKSDNYLSSRLYQANEPFLKFSTTVRRDLNDDGSSKSCGNNLNKILDRS